MDEPGQMTLLANNASIAGYSIRSASESLVPDPDGAAAPLQFYLLNEAREITAGAVGTSVTLDGELVLDSKFVVDGEEDLVFEYTISGQTAPVMGAVTYHPEPATLILLAAGGLLLLRPRSRPIRS